MQDMTCIRSTVLQTMVHFVSCFVSFESHVFKLIQI